MPSDQENVPSGAKAGRVLRLTDGPPSETGPDGVIDRLRLAIAGIPHAEISRRTGVPAQTLKRQLASSRPSPTFLGVFCEKFDVSPDWLLTGRGPRAYSAVPAHWLRTAEPAELFAEVGRQVQAVKDAAAIVCQSKPIPPEGVVAALSMAGRRGPHESTLARARARVASKRAVGAPGVEPFDGVWPRLHRLPFPEGRGEAPRTGPQAGPREGRA